MPQRRQWRRGKVLTNPGSALRFSRGEKRRWLKFHAWKVLPQHSNDGYGVILVRSNDYGNLHVGEVSLRDMVAPWYRPPYYLDNEDRDGILYEAKHGKPMPRDSPDQIVPRRRSRERLGIFYEGRDDGHARRKLESKMRKEEASGKAEDVKNREKRRRY